MKAQGEHLWVVMRRVTRCLRCSLRVLPVALLAVLVLPLYAVYLAGEPMQSVASSREEKQKVAADNSPCLVCHANFEEEPLARRHAKDGVGCVTCHGESLAHRSDENNTTPPDRMYPRSEIDRGCRECHSSHNVPARAVVATYLERCRHITDPRQLVCTDCHGRHRMNYRTILWDRRTGRLLAPGEKPPE